MLRQMLRSKITGLTVTGKELYYEGSITLDEDLLEAAEILPGEKVEVLNLNNGARLETYAIQGAKGAGEVVLNGPAARLGEAGDAVFVLCYGLVDASQALNVTPRRVKTDKKNRPLTP